jgi:acyl-CoA dehydrogenase
MEVKQIAEARTGAGAAAMGELMTRASNVAAVAAKHAMAVDSAARFPAESFQAVKAERLLGIQVPVSLGGEGASISDVADVCYQLGQACASTGMIFAMHQIKVACVRRHMGDNGTLQRMLRRLCAEQLLLASSTTEGQGGGNIRSSEAPVEHHEGGRISLERKASVISYGAYADGVVTTARRAADAAASDQVLVAFFKSDYTLTRLQGWDALGMRGTCSEGYTLKANASAEQILPEPYENIHSRTMVPCAHLPRARPHAPRPSCATRCATADSCRRARRSSPKRSPRCARCAACYAPRYVSTRRAWTIRRRSPPWISRR